MSSPQETALNLCLQPPKEGALRDALAYVRHGQGEELFKELVNITVPSSPSSGTPLGHTMAILEAIVATSPEVGMYLMGKLYVLAGKSDRHVYNAIELWAHHARSFEEAAGIDIAAGEARPLFKKRLGAWAHAIRGRAGT